MLSAAKACAESLEGNPGILRGVCPEAEERGRRSFAALRMTAEGQTEPALEERSDEGLRMTNYSCRAALGVPAPAQHLANLRQMHFLAADFSRANSSSETLHPSLTLSSLR